MKKIILSILISVPFVAYSQPYEIGLGAGISFNSSPYGNELYKGEIATPNYAANLTMLKNLQDNWQFGVEVYVLELSRKANIDYPQLYTAMPGGKDKKFIYGEATTSFCFDLNKKFKMRSGYFYVGAAMGIGAEFSANTRKPTGDVYYKAPTGGIGFVAGPHIGFNCTVNNKISFNTELAMHVYDVNHKAGAPIYAPYADLHYRITAYSLTVGIHYRFDFKKESVTKKIDHILDQKL